MTDLTDTVIPKSDQLNADDLLTGPLDITITAVKKTSSKDQPVNIHYEGDNKRPYKPCKTMRKVMIEIWGSDGDEYVGHKLRLFRDPDVTWAGEKYGGIRISHMTGINQPTIVMVTMNSKKRGPYRVQPFEESQKKLSDDTLKGWTDKLNAAEDMAALAEIGKEINDAGYNQAGKDRLAEIYRENAGRLRG